MNELVDYTKCINQYLAIRYHSSFMEWACDTHPTLLHMPHQNSFLTREVKGSTWGLRNAQLTGASESQSPLTTTLAVETAGLTLLGPPTPGCAHLLATWLSGSFARGRRGPLPSRAWASSTLTLSGHQQCFLCPL